MKAHSPTSDASYAGMSAFILPAWFCLFIIAYLIRQYFNLSLPQQGMALGGFLSFGTVWFQQGLQRHFELGTGLNRTLLVCYAFMLASSALAVAWGLATQNWVLLGNSCIIFSFIPFLLLKLVDIDEDFEPRSEL